MYETTNKSLWRLFANHHYLSADLNNACKMYIATWNGVIVAMDSVLPIPSGTLKNGYREHRLVVLPDYQGLGIGTRLSNALGNYYISNGNKYFCRSTHVKLAKSRLLPNSPWIETSSSRKLRKNVNDGVHNHGFTFDDKRIAYSYEYVGIDYKTKPHLRVVIRKDNDLEHCRKILSQILNKYKNFYIIIVIGTAKQEDNYNYEIACKELGIRTEVLYIKSQGEYRESKKALSQKCRYIIQK